MMLNLLLMFSFVVVACVLCNKVTDRVGMPMLLGFIGVGMLCGVDGIMRISFENYGQAENVCTCALIFIIFYGGFGTKWSEARPVAARSILLSTAGVFLTAGFVGVFGHFVLGMDFLEALLIGSVLGATDAASVFSILRSKRLNLKYGTASMLAVESGSNDPVAYLMTIVLITMIKGSISVGSIVNMVFEQIVYGVAFGVSIALASVWLIRKIRLEGSGFDMVLLLAIAVLAYVLPSMVGGNGYLSAYIAGMILGNSDIPNKKSQVHFFDGVTGLMQVILFFLIGLLSTPSRIPQVLIPAVLIAVFLTFVARPAAVAILLTPFGSKIRQQMLTAWSGLRGASSAVFASSALAAGVKPEQDIFHIVFCVMLLSIAFQGTLLPWVSKRLDMIDATENVLRTFNDYTEEHELQLIRLTVNKGSEWAGKTVRELSLPPGALLVMLIRGAETMIPKGDTIVEAEDVAVLSADIYEDDARMRLTEMEITENHEWCNKEIRQLSLPRNKLIIMIRRHGQSVIPQGDVIICAGDVVVCNRTD